MKKIISKLTLVVIGIMSVVGCSTDFEVAAPYKEIPIVVGLISRSDSVHYIKINKAYLNKEGNAFVAGSVADSNLFPYPLSVKMYALNASGVAFDSVELDTTHIPKEEGVFQSNNIVYKTPAYKLKYIEILPSRDTIWAQYKVVVRRASDLKYIASSTCNIVGDVRFATAPREIDLYNPSPTQTSPEYKTQKLTWMSARNGRRYSAFLRFRFRVENDLTGVYYMDSVDMQLMSNNRLPKNSSDAQIVYSLSGISFFNNLQNKLDPLTNDGDRRVYVGPLEIHFEFAGEELDTYMEINNTTISLSDVVPEYTNIDGGLGIFSSRVRKKFNDIKQVNLSLNTINGLKNNSIVGRGAGSNDLGFY